MFIPLGSRRLKKGGERRNVLLAKHGCCFGWMVRMCRV
jgi:hypothetical protein